MIPQQHAIATASNYNRKRSHAAYVMHGTHEIIGHDCSLYSYIDKITERARSYS